MEEKLRAIVTRIDSSKLDSMDKDELYKMLASGLDAVVLPILLKHMPKDQLAALSADPARVTIELYTKLIDTTFQDGVAFGEIQAAMERLLSETDATLKEAGI